MLPGSVNTFLFALGKVLTFWKKNQKADSLISYTQVTRVEPITIIDQRAMHLSYLSDILQSLNSIFAGYYLQAAALSCTVGKISVGKLLGHLNPDRVFLESRNGALECLVSAPLSAQEDYRYGLPSAAKVGLESLPSTLRTSLEDGYAPGGDEFAENRPGWERNKRKAEAMGEKGEWETEYKARKAAEADAKLTGFQRGAKAWNAGRDSVSDPSSAFKGEATGFSLNDKLNKGLSEAINLSVGRVYTVELSSDQHKASVPVTIRLITTECAPELMVHILSDGSRVRNSTSKERWFGFKMKDLRFWRDIVACTDLIEEHKRALLQDSNDVYATILKRRAKNKVTAIATQEPSVGSASNIAVMSRQTARDIEKEIGGKLDNFQVREMVFAKSYLIIMVIIDPDFDHVTFYHRGIAIPTELSVRDVKAASKGTGPDVAEILKAFQLGNAPSF